MTARTEGVDLKFRPWREPPDGKRHRSLWLRTALGDESTLDVQRLQESRKVDVCIIGGGFTGLWTANRLCELVPGSDIAIVEADLCGTGASGRNSGGMGHWWSKLPSLLRKLGRDDAVFVLNKSVAILDEIADFVAQHQIQCELRRGASVWTATSKAHVGAWDELLRLTEGLGLQAPYRVLDAAELAPMFGRGPYYAGVVEDGAMRVQPAMLARGLRRVALGHGVKIFEKSPVSRILSTPDGVLVETLEGRILAQRVVLAANAWMAHMAPFRQSVMVISSDIIFTDPIPEVLQQRGLQNRPGSRNSQLMMNYGGRTPDGRIYLGRGGGSIAFNANIGAEFDYSRDQAAEIEQDFRYLYPDLADVPIAGGWAGPIDRSTTGLPFFGRLEDPRVHYAIGYTGHGVAASAMAGHALAAALADRSNDWTRLSDCLARAREGSFPPEPVRYLGGRVVRAGVLRKERAEREGRQPAWLDAQLAKLAPATMTDVFRRKAN